MLGPFAFLRPYRVRTAVGCVMLLATSALALTIPWVLGRTVEALRGDAPHTDVPPLAMAMIGLAIGQAITRIASRIALFNAAREAEHDLRSRLFAHLLTLEPGFYRGMTTGDVMSRLTSDVQTVRVMWGPGLLNLVNTSFMYAVALVLMVSIDLEITLWALLPYPSMVFVGIFFGRRIYRYSRQVQVQLGALSASIQEDLTGIGLIKAYGLEDERHGRFSTSSRELLDRNMALTRIRGMLVPVLGATAALGTVVVLYMGTTAVIEERITLGEMIQFNSYLMLLVWPTLALGWMLSLFQRGMASWDRLKALLTTAPEIADGDGAPLEPSDTGARVTLSELSVRFDDRKVLDSVSLDVPAGSITAIVGRVGSGKSTLVEAIPRLIEIPPDTVFIDDRDVTDLRLAELRSCIGYAPQEAFLFSTTIADNIAFGLDRSGERLDEDERQARIESAARAAGLSRDISALPAGYDTVVGERGITLSGGQRQRVALARAIASQPRVLILDDSLSSVDAETEAEILGHLDEVMKGRTAIIISHRVAAVRRADQIAVIDDGALIEVGTHDELLARGGVYAELYSTQLEALLDQGDPA